MDIAANWLWQGCALACAAELMAVPARRLGASARHALWCVALAIVLVLPVLAAVRTHAPADVRVTPLERLSAQTAATRIDAAAPILQLPSSPWLVAGLVTVWAAWLGVSLLRLAAGLRGVRLARRGSAPFPVDRERRLPHWNRIRHHGRASRLVISDRVRCAGVLGAGRPLIALSPALLVELTDAELDLVVAHEWTHVQRRDDVTTLVQAVAGAIAGLHPAVWWLGRRIAAERELACDERTVRVLGSVKSYARCLARLAELRTPGRPLQLAPAAGSRPQLATRIVRLLDTDGRGVTRAASRAMAVTTAACLATLASMTADVRLIATSPFAAVMDVKMPRPSASGAAAAPQTMGVRQRASASKAQDARPVSADPGRQRPMDAPRPQRSSPERQTPAPLPVSSSSLALESLPTAAGHGANLAAPPLAAPGLHAVPALSAAEGPGAFVDVPGAPLVPAADAPPSSTADADATRADGPASTPWGAAADAGVAIGRGSSKAAVATAGFFNRFGRRIATSF